jgi:Family of unknown function (DUF5681)
MRFQSGQSGNPAGRPPGSLNRKTLAAQEAMIERAQELIDSMVDRAKNGDSAAMRAAMERLVPTGRNRRVAIDLPVIKTPEDAELALSVVTDELAAGNLTISEASALINLIDRMLRVAERMWNFARSRRYGARRDAILLEEQEAPAASETGDSQAQTAEKPKAPLYSPVNSAVTPRADATGEPAGREAEIPPSGAPQETTAPPLARAA